MKPLVYVAGPITKPDPLENAHHAILLCDQLMTDGVVVPFCPHLSVAHQMVAPRTWEQWLVYDESVIQHCHAVLRLPGESKGADREVDYVREGRDGHGVIPVFHHYYGFGNGLQQLYAWAAQWVADQQLVRGA